MHATSTVTTSEYASIPTSIIRYKLLFTDYDIPNNVDFSTCHYGRIYVPLY